MKILLLGCGGNAGINYVKCLRKGVLDSYIVGIDINQYNLQLSNANATYFGEYSDVEQKINFINEVIKTHSIEYIHAQPDPEVEFLLNYGHRLHANIFPLDAKVYGLLKDKQKFQNKVSEVLGLQYLSYGLDEVDNDPLLFQEILDKSGKVWFRAKSGAGSKAALPISDMNMVNAWAKYWQQKNSLEREDFQICEFLPGREFAVQTLWIDGVLMHSQARERLVYFFGSLMPSGQSSTPAVAKTINDPKVYDLASHVVNAVVDRPHGIFCVDMKTNSNGQIIPTEINYGRFFTTSDFFATIGINTPYELSRYVVHSTLPNIKINSVGTEKFWIRGLDVEPVLRNNL